MREIDCTLSWWPPGDIIFCPEQLVWLLMNYELISNCIWPRDPFGVPSDYLSPHSYFESPTAVWMEFSPRFYATGQDGKMARLRYAYQTDDREIAELTSCELDEVDDRIARAMEYMNTRKRRKRSYHDFVSHPRHKKPPVFVAKYRNFTKHSKENLGGNNVET